MIESKFLIICNNCERRSDFYSDQDMKEVSEESVRRGWCRFKVSIYDTSLDEHFCPKCVKSKGITKEGIS